MELYILRHGIAVELDAAGGTDSERALTSEGERKVWRIAEAMEKMELVFDAILSSPYVRARQTAEIVAEAYKSRKKLQLADELKPGGEQRELIERLKRLRPEPGSVLLVGHEPYLSEL